MVVSGAAKLTAAAGIDPAGAGYLRLNENITNSVGYAYGQNAFPSNYGLTISFEFFSWKTGATSTNQADGMTFFLFDASVNAFRPGGTGGSLGYAQYYSTPGLAKGYLGISLDEFGNFSSASDGNKNGGPGQQRGSVAIRGPGNGKGLADYVYQTGVIASDPAYNAGFATFSQRYFDPLNANYRKIKIILTPGSSLGAAIGYKITVIMFKGGATLSPVTLINNYDYPFAAPAALKFGLAASTGSITNYHEVRNMSIDATNTGSLAIPTAVNDAGASVCQGQQALIDVTANDVSNNTGGTINKASIDLDPTTGGQQLMFTDMLKGTFTADSNGIVAFAPVAGYSGNASVSYTVGDNYGITSNPATLTVTASSSAGPTLVLADPPAVCAPALIDITSNAWKTSTTVGASYSYYSNLNDANLGTNNINALASILVLPGTYYIRADLGGCRSIRPIKAVINAIPTVAFAGTDQTFCSSTGVQNSVLIATNPDIGSGSWMQVSGPAGATINYPAAATSPIAVTQQGLYTFRWSVASGACATSSSDMQVSVGNTVAVAGVDQVISNASIITLAGNTPAIGTGKWTVLSSPLGSTATIAQPTSPTTTVMVNRTGTYNLKWTTTNGGCSSSAVMVANILSLLPVKLLSFQAVRAEDSAVLNWTTSLEINNARFDVERSTDGISFLAVHTLPGAGFSGTPRSYRWVDAVGTLGTSDLFYRLRQVDADGKSDYSKIVKLAGIQTTGLHCWPNPLSDKLYLQVPAGTEGLSQLKLYDAKGLLLKQWMQTATAGTVLAFKLNGIRNGSLFAVFSTSTKNFEQQLIKVR